MKRVGAGGLRNVVSCKGQPMLIKALANDFPGRFREILADPLNLLIRRYPGAGIVDEGYVTLHNGHRVPLSGEGAYYGDFSRILVFNRGVHEPLEEFAFQSLIPYLPERPVMLELGAYWAHYSMWMAQARPRAQLHLVEPDPEKLKSGQANLARNGYEGRFFREFVGRGGFSVDAHMAAQGLEWITLLHSDIQGFELEMLEGAKHALSGHRISHLFVSTHSQVLHRDVVQVLKEFGYRIEVSSDFERHSTSFDGFAMATAPGRPAVFQDEPPFMGREDIARATPQQLLAYLTALAVD